MMVAKGLPYQLAIGGMSPSPQRLQSGMGGEVPMARFEVLHFLIALTLLNEISYIFPLALHEF